MNGKDFIKAVNLIVEEKKIDREIVFEAMELALATAYKRNFNSLTNSKIFIDRETGDIKVFSYKTVVDDDMPTEVEEIEDEVSDEEETEEKERVEVFNENYHIRLKDARKQDKSLNIGDTIDTEVTPKDFGRVATSTAKQVIVQKIREAERNAIFGEFGDKQDELLIGTVELEDVDNFFINLGRSNGILPKKECIPGEKIEMGKQIKVYVSKVEVSPKGLLILLSRNHYGFLKRLFEIEIPELSDGSVVISSVAREAGYRSKIAVYSTHPSVDPIGTCIGEKGSRIERIIKELNGERIDVIKYDKDPSNFISNALSPAKNLHVIITDPKKQEAIVVADEDNFSLAIGKKGMNARLASKLTHYKIDIKNTEQAKEMGIHFKN